MFHPTTARVGVLRVGLSVEYLYLQHMESFFRSLMRMAGSRLARNVYFWAALMSTRLGYRYTPASAACSAILFVLLMALCYTNTLLLVPRLFSKKRYASYLFLYAVL